MFDKFVDWGIKICMYRFFYIFYDSFLNMSIVGIFVNIFVMYLLVKFWIYLLLIKHDLLI